MRISDWSSDVCSSDLAFRPQSWRQTAETTRLLARGLTALGVKPGERVALVAENRPEWLIADHAIMSAGRSEERRVGKECVGTCRSRWSQWKSNKNREKLRRLIMTNIIKTKNRN